MNVMDKLVPPMDSGRDIDSVYFIKLSRSCGSRQVYTDMAGPS